jgi:hypothetical protein
MRPSDWVATVATTSATGAISTVASKAAFRKPGMIILMIIPWAKLSADGCDERNDLKTKTIVSATAFFTRSKSVPPTRQLPYTVICGYRDRPMRTQCTIEAMLPITQSVMNPPINHKNSSEFAIRMIRRPK